MIFCFDTNAFIEPWNRRYPIDLFADFWSTIDEMGQNGIVLATEEVLKELKKVDDDLHRWTNERSHIFRAIDDDVQDQVIAILDSHPHLVNAIKNRSMADPFVIAQALSSGAAVVSEELPDPRRRADRVKIPEVCAAYRVECINVLEFMRRTGMQFQLR